MKRPGNTRIVLRVGDNESYHTAAQARQVAETLIAAAEKLAKKGSK